MTWSTPTPTFNGNAGQCYMCQLIDIAFLSG
jgi:hypothetical protein